MMSFGDGLFEGEMSLAAFLLAFSTRWIALSFCFCARQSTFGTLCFSRVMSMSR